jgi:hypothetical protein
MMKWPYNSMHSHSGHQMEASVELRASAALISGEEPQYTSDMRLGWPQSWSLRCREEINPPC